MEKIISKFKNGECKVVIATDVAARGIDVDGITLVINYDVPDDVDNYVHRIGRTGRAGKKGTAITFVLKKDTKYLQEIEKLIKMKIKNFKINLEEKKLKDYEFETLNESKQSPNFLKR